MSKKARYVDTLEKYMNNLNMKLSKAELEKELKRFLDIIETYYKDTQITFFPNISDSISDRELAIICASIVDQQLERLLTTFFIKVAGVKKIFKDEHILNSLYSKINIVYYSGLIPKWLYNDLVIINNIRNKFAHTYKADLKFDDKYFNQKIDSCELRPKTLDSIKVQRIKYVIVVSQVLTLLQIMNALLDWAKPKNFVESFGIKDWKYEEMALKKEEIIEIIKIASRGDIEDRES